MHYTLSSLNPSMHLTSVCLANNASSTVSSLSSIACSIITVNDNVNKYDNLFSEAQSSFSYLESSHKLHETLLELMHNRRLRKLQEEYQHKKFIENKKWNEVNREVRFRENKENSTGNFYVIGGVVTEKIVSSGSNITEQEQNMKLTSSQEAEVVCESLNSRRLLKEETMTNSSTRDETTRKEKEQRHNGNKNSMLLPETFKETLSPIYSETQEIQKLNQKKHVNYKHDLLIQLLLRYRAKRSQIEEQNINSNSDDGADERLDDTKQLLRNVHIMKESEKCRTSQEIKSNNQESEELKKRVVRDGCVDDAQVREWDEVYKMFLETVTLTSKSNSSTSNELTRNDNINNKNESSKPVVCPTIYHINILLEYALLMYHFEGFDDAFDFYVRFACAVNELLEEKMNRLMLLQTHIAFNVDCTSTEGVDDANLKAKYTHEHLHEQERQVTIEKDMDGKLNECKSDKEASTLSYRWSWMKPWTNDILLQSVNKPFSHLASLPAFVVRAENSKRLSTSLEENQHHLQNSRKEKVHKIAKLPGDSTKPAEMQENENLLPSVEQEKAMAELYSEIVELSKIYELLLPNKHTFLLLMQRHYLTGNWMEVIREFHTAEQMNSVVDEEMLDMLFIAYLQITPDQVHTLTNDNSENVYTNNYDRNYDKEQYALCLPDRYLMYIIQKYHRAIYNVCTLSHLVNAIVQFYNYDDDDDDNFGNESTNVCNNTEQIKTQNSNANKNVLQCNEVTKAKINNPIYTQKTEHYIHTYLLEIYTCRGRLLLKEPFFQSANCTQQEWQAALCLLRQFSNAAYGAICQENAKVITNTTKSKSKASILDSTFIEASSRNALHKVNNELLEILIEVEHVLQNMCLQEQHYRHYFEEPLSWASTKNNKLTESDILEKRFEPLISTRMPWLLHQEHSKSSNTNNILSLTIPKNGKCCKPVETPHDVAEVLLLNILRSLYLTRQYNAVLQRFYEFQVKCKILASHNNSGKSHISNNTNYTNDKISYLSWTQISKRTKHLLTRQSTMHSIGKENTVEYNEAFQYVIGWSTAALVVVAKAAMATQNVDLMIELCHFHFTLLSSESSTASYSLGNTQGIKKIYASEEVFYLTIHAIQSRISQSLLQEKELMESNSENDKAKARRSKYIILQEQVYDEFITRALSATSFDLQQMPMKMTSRQGNHIINVNSHMNDRGNENSSNSHHHHKHSALLSSSPVHVTLVSLLKEASVQMRRYKLSLGKSSYYSINFSENVKYKNKVQESKSDLEWVTVATRRLSILLEETRRPDGFVMLLVCDLMHKLFVLSKEANESVMPFENENSEKFEEVNSCPSNTSLLRQLMLSLLLRHSAISSWLTASLSTVQCTNLFSALSMFDWNEEQQWQWEPSTLLFIKFIRICVTEGMPYFALNLLQFAIHEHYLGGDDKVTCEVNESISQLLRKRLTVTFNKLNEPIVKTLVTTTDNVTKKQNN